jgi:hypothetical protein
MVAVPEECPDEIGRTDDEIEKVFAKAAVN